MPTFFLSLLSSRSTFAAVCIALNVSMPSTSHLSPPRWLQKRICHAGISPLSGSTRLQRQSCIIVILPPATPVSCLALICRVVLHRLPDSLIRPRNVACPTPNAHSCFAMQARLPPMDESRRLPLSARRALPAAAQVPLLHHELSYALSVWFLVGGVLRITHSVGVGSGPYVLAKAMWRLISSTCEKSVGLRRPQVIRVAHGKVSPNPAVISPLRYQTKSCAVSYHVNPPYCQTSLSHLAPAQRLATTGSWTALGDSCMWLSKYTSHIADDQV
jgi:hypothetical protein